MFVISALASVISAQTFQSCAAGIYNVESTSISPYPLVHGQNVTIHAFGTTSGVITNGSSLDVSVYKGRIRIYHQTLDLCAQSLLQTPPVSCPIAPGNQTLDVTQLVPSIIPAGTYNMTIVGTNGDKSTINCLTSNIQVV
ncbi:Phosphatidylglycerol/phosphatidylinositol transfer protein [Boothiomyces sp. JEL0838]|nr:Phosphatidylglycerol/phosphatidylinositol transfer protein [Boothiomyces sp. JEL0838]